MDKDTGRENDPIERWNRLSPKEQEELSPIILRALKSRWIMTVLVLVVISLTIFVVLSYLVLN